MIGIREATKEDYHFIHRLQKQVHEIHCKGKPDHYQMADTTLDRSYYESLFDDEHSRIFVVEVDGKIVAYAIVKIKEPDPRPILVPKTAAYVRDFGVDQDYRRKGIGRMLFSYLVDFAKNFGANVLELDVWEFNKEAFRFYEEMGMETVTRKMERKLQSR